MHSARRHHPERHHQGVPLAGDLRLPARALAAADHRPDRLHGQPHPEVEPDQHLQLPPAGGRRDADAGARLRAVHGDRRARHRARLRARSPHERLRDGRRPDLVLRQRRRAVRRGDVQDARVRRSCGTRSPASATASRTTKMRRFRYGVQVNSLGPDRGAAGEQRAADRARDARRHAVQGRPRPRRTAAGVERGARPAAALGPAVVAAAAAGAGLRVRPAGVRRPLRGLARRRGEGRRARRRRPRRDGPGAGDGRRGRGGRVRLHEAGAGLLARGTPRPHRVRRGQGRRGQLLRDHRAVAADRRPRRRDPGRRPRGRARPRSQALAAWRAERDQAAVDEALDGARARPPRPTPT